MLYGDNADEATAREKMPFMIPVYNLLEKYAGKVIYVDFWGVTCPPCLEMEPLKELRKRYSPDDVVMASVCGSRDREAYHKILERFSLRGKNIECIYSEDWALLMIIIVSWLIGICIVYRNSCSLTVMELL
mgnify:CR=1 FL=1